MPELMEIAEIRARLEGDRAWSLYALGHLTPEQRRDCRWFGAPDGALALLYCAFDMPIFFAVGVPASVRVLLAETDAREMFALVRPEIVPVLEESYTLHSRFPTWRMVLNPSHHLPGFPTSVSRLEPNDLAALKRLYADDEREDGDPRFFMPSMLEQGIYYGVREGDEVVAVAGTHLVAPSEGVGAIGNVYTRRDRRERGLAAQTVGAVIRHLQQMELPTIGLNVVQHNVVAVRLYERLGFARSCAYVGAYATRILS